jgi:secretion/DNA translocation related CpaE-like protein
VAVPDRPLLLTADPLLLDELLRLAAAAGVEPRVAHDVVAAQPWWGSAPLVLLGADVVDDLARAGLPRRDGVIVVVPQDGDVADWTAASVAGAETVQSLPGGEAVLVDRLAEAATPSRGTTVAVVGGRGGAGASTLACGLAHRAAQTSPVLLVDADPLGGGLDLVLGAEGAAGLRWPDLSSARGRTSPAELRAALPRVGDLSVVTWDRQLPVSLPAEAMESVLGAGRRGHDVVVVDLPRTLDAAATAAAVAADVVLLVVPAEVRAVAAAAQVALRLLGQVRDLRVVVRGPAPSGLTAELVARELALPQAGWLDAEPGLAAALERGEPPGRSGRGPLARCCAGLLATLDGLRGAAVPAGRVR